MVEPATVDSAAIGLKIRTREFMRRRLRRAPVIRPLWDEWERMLGERNAAVAERDAALAERVAATAERDAALADRVVAVAERDTALAECVAAVVERDTAVAERAAARAERDAALSERKAALTARDAALAAADDDYSQLFSRHPEAVRDFRTPTRFALTPTPMKRVLVVGSCFAEGIAHQAWRAIPGCEGDHLLYNHYGELPPEPPRPISEYDLQIVVLPLRLLIPERTYLRLDYADRAAHEALYQDAVSRLHHLLDRVLVYSRRFGKLTFVANFLVPQENPLGRLLPASDLRNPAYLCRRLNAELEAVVHSLPEAYVLDLDGLAASFGKRWVQDDFIAALNHGAFIAYQGGELAEIDQNERLEPVMSLFKQLPFLGFEFIRALWQEIAAMYRTVRQVDPIKLVVIDLDDTLWRGIAADEQSIDAARMIEGWPLGFMEALQYAKKRGVLLAIISKNEAALIQQHWPLLCGGLIELADFAAIKINWRRKVENMDELLGEVNLLPRNVLFIDDNPVERAAMEAAYPDMRIIGSNPFEHRRLLLWAPEMQVPIITAESASRTAMIQAQINREESRRHMPHAEFLASLGVTFRLIAVTTTDHPQFRRSFELLNKTNQFNTTGKRWTMEEIAHLLAEGAKIFGFEVSDKFTPYGLVGVIIMNGAKFEQFVMSCRVVGLDVELAAISMLSQQVCSNGRDRVIRALTRETDANLLSRDVWRRCGFEWTGELWQAEPSAIVAIPPHIEIRRDELMPESV